MAAERGSQECKNLTYDAKVKGGWYCKKYKTAPPNAMKCQNALLLCYKEK